MLSLAFDGTRRLFPNTPTYVDKANFIAGEADKYLPWVELAIGIILVILGGVALNHGVMMEAFAAKWLIGVGSVEMLAVIFRGCFNCGQKYYPTGMSLWQGGLDSLQNAFADVGGAFGNIMGRGLDPD